MLGKIEGRRRRGHQRMRCLDSITNTMDMNLGKLQEMVRDREACCVAIDGDHKESDMTVWLNNPMIILFLLLRNRPPHWFPQGSAIFAFPTSSEWRSQFVHIFSKTCYFCFAYNNHCSGCEVVSHGDFYLHFSNGNNLRYADDTTLMAENEEELKSLLMKVKEDSQKVGWKLNIQKTKIMASGPITSWQIDGETVADFIFMGSKITADGDCSHEIKRQLLLGRKVMTNLDSILKSRDITLST